MTVKRMEIGPIMSRVVEYGGVVHLCGLTADDQSQTIEGQTQQVLEKIDTPEARAALGQDMS